MDTAADDDPHAITVCWRGGDRWAITLGVDWSPGRVWCEANSEWEWEPSPSNRDDDFLARTRYPIREALRIAARLNKPPTIAVTDSWLEVATLPKGKYVVVEADDGWHVYEADNHGEFS